MRQDRFLTGILIGIGALVVLSLALYLARPAALDYLPEDNPAGVVHNYAIALQRGDYARAYTYLAQVDNLADVTRFSQAFINYQGREVSNASLQTGAVTIAKDGKTAQVSVAVLRSGNSPFDSGSRENTTAQLVLSGSVWKISSMPYPFWNYEIIPPSPAETKPIMPVQP
jgi:hypothetical protein